MYRKRGRRIEDNFVQLKLVPDALIQFDYLHMLKSRGGRGRGENAVNISVIRKRKIKSE